MRVTNDQLFGFFYYFLLFFFSHSLFLFRVFSVTECHSNKIHIYCTIIIICKRCIFNRSIDKYTLSALAMKFVKIFYYFNATSNCPDLNLIFFFKSINNLSNWRIFFFPLFRLSVSFLTVDS